MVLPEQSVTLTVEQIAALNSELANMRHEVNNHTCLVLNAAELIRMKPERTEHMVAVLLEQPTKITEAMKQFSVEFEKTFGIKRV